VKIVGMLAGGDPLMPSSHQAISHHVRLFTAGAYGAAIVNVMGAAMDKAWADFEPLPGNRVLARSLMAGAIIEGIEAGKRDQDVLVRTATVTLMAAIKVDPEALRAGRSSSVEAARAKREAEEGEKIVGGQIAPPRSAPLRVKPAKSAPDSRFMQLAELTATTCRWPLGNPTDDDFSFCGAPCHPPYCTHHSRIAYRRASNPANDPLRKAQREQRLVTG
jgi:hypothetical protein